MCVSFWGILPLPHRTPVIVGRFSVIRISCSSCFETDSLLPFPQGFNLQRKDQVDLCIFPTVVTAFSRLALLEASSGPLPSVPYEHPLKSVGKNLCVSMAPAKPHLTFSNSLQILSELSFLDVGPIVLLLLPVSQSLHLSLEVLIFP